MILSRVLLLGVMFLTLGSCIAITKGPESKYSKPTDLLKEDTYESAALIGPVFIGERKAVTRKISGRIYCGEGMKQVPASRATVTIKNNEKVVRSTSTESDGSYSFSSTFELAGEYKFAISARCGQLTAAVPSDLTNDLIHQDFWIK